MNRAFFLALVLTACAGSKGSEPGSGQEPGPQPGSTAASSGGGDPRTDPPASDAWATVEKKTADVVNQHGIKGLGIAVYDAQDKKVYEKMFGDFAPDRRVPIASASKLVSGLVLFSLVDKGKLSLDSTTGTVLGWTGPKANITLRHLLSFTSGLKASHSCTTNPQMKLEQCVEAIAQGGAVALPGKQFEYGPVHLAVAGRMAEVVMRKTWNEIFTETVAKPLALSDLGYTTLPRSGTGTTNPLVAAGLTASMDEYRSFLATAFHKGTFNGTTIAKASLFETQATEPYPSAAIAGSPLKDMGLPFHYGLASWLECPPPATACNVISSPGAWGFTPWFDRETGYYAVIGTFINSTGEDGVVDFTVNLAQDLKPEIKKALGH